MAEPTNKLETSKRSSRAPQVIDALVRHTITAGGVLVIISVVGIIAFILLEAFPLFQGAEVSLAAAIPSPEGAEVLAVGSDEYNDLVYEVLSDGRVQVRSLPGGERQAGPTLEGMAGASLEAAAVDARRDAIVWGDTTGRVGLAMLSLRTQYLPGGDRDTAVSVRKESWIDLPSEGAGFVEVAAGADDEDFLAVGAILEDGRLLVGVQPTAEATPHIHDLSDALEGAATAMSLSQDGRLLAVGTGGGEVFVWSLNGADPPRYLERIGVSETSDTSVTAMAFLLGDQSLVVGTEDGGLSVWSRVPVPELEGRRLRRIHAFPVQPEPVATIGPSPRDKGFLTGHAGGLVRLHYSTSERTLATMALEAPPQSVVLTPRADGALALLASGDVRLWDVHNPHPEVSWKALFGKVWYEGLPEPAYVWQSTGGSDDFEPKLSLIPLLFGTIKGAFYAMLFSVPIALLGAIYTAQFAHPRIKKTVKPFVEILAALPSVIIGFLAGLWLAPLLVRLLPGVTLMVGLVPLAVLACVFGWELLPRDLRKRIPRGGDLSLVLVVTLGAGLISLLVGPSFERFLFGGDMVHWLRQDAGFNYDQRNCVVVGFALGFAVIPIIFTIAEDALSSVPRHLTSASLALGANRWSTTWRVVVPTASAGIFAAVMLGFGRAVGETMIVLMATGNTPILDWNIFTGMRTLSANIAVEIPEAPYGGTLYRVLFLSAALLFVLTFLTNTLAEVVGHRLRRKYQRL